MPTAARPSLEVRGFREQGGCPPTGPASLGSSREAGLKPLLPAAQTHIQPLQAVGERRPAPSSVRARQVEMAAGAGGRGWGRRGPPPNTPNQRESTSSRRTCHPGLSARLLGL